MLPLHDTGELLVVHGLHPAMAEEPAEVRVLRKLKPSSAAEAQARFEPVEAGQARPARATFPGKGVVTPLPCQQKAILRRGFGGGRNGSISAHRSSSKISLPIL